MSVKERLMTAEQFLKMPDPPDKRLELVDGVVGEKPLMGMLAARVLMRTATTLSDFAEEHDLGLVLPGLGCVLKRDPDTVRRIGICFLPREQVSSRELSDAFWEGAPAVAVEVVTLDTLAYDLLDRRCDYLEAGSKVVWVLWPDSRSMTVHLPGGRGRQLGPEATLDGGDVLPGFSVRVGDLFEIL